MARPFYPDGVDGNPPGPFTPLAQWSPFKVGQQLDLVYNRLAVHVAFYLQQISLTVSLNGTTLQTALGDVKIAQVYSACRMVSRSSPAAYRYSGNVLVGGIGVSGDGVDQDDMVSFLGLSDGRTSMWRLLARSPTRRRPCVPTSWLRKARTCATWSVPARVLRHERRQRLRGQMIYIKLAPRVICASIRMGHGYPAFSVNSACRAAGREQSYPACFELLGRYTRHEHQTRRIHRFRGGAGTIPTSRCRNSACRTLTASRSSSTRQARFCRCRMARHHGGCSASVAR